MTATWAARSTTSPVPWNFPPDHTNLLSNKERSTPSKLIMLLFCTGSGSRPSQVDQLQRGSSRTTFTVNGLAWESISHRHSLSFRPTDPSQPSTRRSVALKSVSPRSHLADSQQWVWKYCGQQPIGRALRWKD